MSQQNGNGTNNELHLENGHENGTKGYVFISPLNEKFIVPESLPKCTWSATGGKGKSPHDHHPWRRQTKILPDVLHAIGNTPIVKLNKIPQQAGLKCNVYVKCEYVNPGGSIKDRIALRMIQEAEEQGLLKPGYTIIEPSSGNTGIGVALIAAVKGYRCIIVMCEKMSNEKISTLQALGAETIRTPITANSYSPEGMFSVAHRLKDQIPNSIILDQYSNPGNPLAHYDSTAEEILDQLEKKIDMIVIGAGTGGTVTGIGRRFKEVSPQIKIVGVDPEGSVFAYPEELNKTDVTFYEVEGLGYDFVPTVLDRHVVDTWIKTNDEESLVMARRLIREEGLLCGTSSGAAMVAALKTAKDLKEGQNVVVILPDSIRNYITKFVCDQWMEARGLQPAINTKNHWWWNINVLKLDLQKETIKGSDTHCSEVLNRLDQYRIDELPVIDEYGFLLGLVTRQNLENNLISGEVKLTESISKILIRIYPKVYKNATMGVISRVLEKESYVLVLEKDLERKNDRPVGIAKAKHILLYISKNAP